MFGPPRGPGPFDPRLRTGRYENGAETPDVRVVLATAIPEEPCRRIGLGYLDPATVRIDDCRGREEEGVLFVDHAGEVLCRLAGAEGYRQ